jgi:NADH-quinone oxidoreductase subunit L
MTNIDMCLYGVILLPLLGAIVSWVMPSARLSGLAAFVCGALGFLCSLLLYGPSTAAPVQAVLKGAWLDVGSLHLALSFVVDRLAIYMLLLITGVGSLIQLYSVGYMAGDPGERRYYSYVSLFLFFMIVLVTGASLPLLFVGWEGVGLCSYLLIGFWYRNDKYCSAAQKAFIVNRIGDAGFLISLMALFLAFGTWEISALADQISAGLGGGKSTLLLAGFGLIGLIFAVTAKSAQIPLFVWLPDAMAGPTPVSALIHAATMVTAGVYLLARMHFLCAAFPDIMAVLLVIATVTSVMAALTACTQLDIKKVLAYSTVSQLGFMVIAAAAGLYGIALFHVLTHAFFKACLFLGAGSVIHECDHDQDLADFGGLLKKMPITGICFGVASLALAGVAPLSGFYSKYLISHFLVTGGLASHHSILGVEAHAFLQTVEICIWITSFLTSFYIARVFFLTFLGEYRGSAEPHEVPLTMGGPVVVLAIGSILAGLFFLEAPFFLGIEQPVMGHKIHGITSYFTLDDVSGFWLKNVVALLGIGTAAAIFFVGGHKALLSGHLPLLVLKPLADRKFFWDEVYGYLIVRPFKITASVIRGFIEPYLIDGIVDSAWMTVVAMGECGRSLHSGQVRHYALQLFGVLLGLLLFYMIL